MAATPIALYSAPSVVPDGGTAIIAVYGPVLGGFIQNPATADDQGLSSVEVLYINIYGVAATAETGGTVSIQPGQIYTLPQNMTTNVSINAASDGHKFSIVIFQPYSPVTPADLIGIENPCLQAVIPSYLYEQYQNDDDLQAFVSSFNTMAQEYVTWFNDINLPVYTNPMITGDLLDWVATGLYGVPRPVFTSGTARIRGGFNTGSLNGPLTMFNGYEVIGAPVFIRATDDIYKRVLTWKLYKGDGKTINIRWLKRRILRFCLGANGEDVNTADTQLISVTFGGNPIEIYVVTDTTYNEARGQTFNTVGFNRGTLNMLPPSLHFRQDIEVFEHDNQINIEFLSPPLPNIEIFKEAIEQGVLDFPFQFKVEVTLP